MAVGKVEVLLKVSGLDVERNAEAYLVNLHINIKEGDMGGKVNRVGTIE